MGDPSSRLPQTLWLGLGLLLGFLGLAYLLSLAEFNRQHRQPLPVIGAVAGFTLTNQDGKVTTLADLTNRVWVADIIFTRCAGPCPVITGHMKSLEDALPKTNNARLVTLTTDPDYDTPADDETIRRTLWRGFQPLDVFDGNQGGNRRAGQRAA